MKVEHILRGKGSDVFAVRDTASIQEAVAVLAEKNVGAVIVRNAAGAVAGILSERDVVRRLKADGAAALSGPVSACMTSAVVTCRLEDTVDELMAKMTERRIRHVPVVEQGELVGIVSIGDVVKRKIEESEQEAAALRDYITS